MTTAGWKRVATLLDTVSAEAVRRLLVAEGVPAAIRSDSSLLGEARSCEVVVPPAWVQRAQEILEERQVSEAELERLATRDAGDSGAGGQC
ncbi:MAG: DUF2007 domain-containing protein [Gammaproteobacteria bacterium]|nr:DUF2007 domain-containing protein [Gammaproteobacteria bacterium]MCZ7600441.1 hypothetical protein [Gammaproteobacteria bacterium]QOJ32437.1 MAG: DUF2007 domain-containing protein [Gammaproteobacteria bacterium]CAG0932424.1 hypothetical protein RHDC3_02204 [Rhodocyclaceae bacterium]